MPCVCVPCVCGAGAAGVYSAAAAEGVWSAVWPGQDDHQHPPGLCPAQRTGQRYEAEHSHRSEQWHRVLSCGVVLCWLVFGCLMLCPLLCCLVMLCVVVLSCHVVCCGVVLCIIL